MWEIWAEWDNGEVECVDEADSITAAEYVVQEYTLAYGIFARRIWKQRA